MHSTGNQKVHKNFQNREKEKENSHRLQISFLEKALSKPSK